MKRTRLTEEQIIGVLPEQEVGMKTAEACRKHGISGATFYYGMFPPRNLLGCVLINSPVYFTPKTGHHGGHMVMSVLCQRRTPDCICSRRSGW